jgi:HK97 gp10 family phage protein
VTELVKVSGLHELEQQLRSLGEEFGPKAAISPVRRALGKAAKVVQASAQQRVHVKSGTLRENIITTTYRNPPDGQIGVKVTVRAKAKAYKSNSRNVRQGRVGLDYNNLGPLVYGVFLEFGHPIVSKKGQVIGHAPPYPFMRAAFEENKSQLPELIKSELAKAIDASVKRLKK